MKKTIESIESIAVKALVAHGVEENLAKIAGEILRRDADGLNRTSDDQFVMRRVTAALNKMDLDDFDAACRPKEAA